MNKIHTTAILAHCTGVMGLDGGLPAHSTEDLKFFKATTANHVLVMGRKTVESLPFKLPNRTVIALSRDSSYASSKCDYTATTVEEVYALARSLVKHDQTLFIAGGAEVYRLFAPHLNAAYITDLAPQHFDSIDLSKHAITYVPREIQDFAANATVRYVHKTLSDATVYYCSINAFSI